MSRKGNIKQLLTYIFNESKIKNGEQKPIVIRKNVRTRTVQNNVKEFEKNAASRKYQSKNSVKAYHTVISFNAKDKEQITEGLLKDITMQYIELKGKDALYVATVHYDKFHPHIHIAESGTKYMTGMANRISKHEFSSLKIALQDKYPGLTNSLPKHGTGANKAYPNVHVRQSQKAQLQELLSNAFQTAKSQEALIKQVTESGHTPYFRNGKLTGIQFEGDRKYRFTTLGYTKEKVQELAQREDKDNKELDEIESIRNEADSIDRENESLSRTLDEIDDKGEHEPDSEKETENEYEQ